jgi:predicted GNAT superfamily acetyltransferase
LWLATKPIRDMRGTIDAMAGTELDLPRVPGDVRARAAASARHAAERAGIVVRTLDTVAELDDASRLIGRIWDDDGDPKAPTSLLKALVHADNFVAGAFADDQLVGVSLGFLGLEEAELHLHSHITGIDREYQGRSLGFALKQFQRSWALERDLRTILWTADPLVRGNAFFNLVKLGSAMVAYHENFYGFLEDGLNSGDSDRVVLRWDLASSRAVDAAEGRVDEPSANVGCVVLKANDDGAPATYDAEGDVLLAWLPESIVRMRAENPERAETWRGSLRRTVGGALADGFRAESITRDGWLVLRR